MHTTEKRTSSNYLFVSLKKKDTFYALYNSYNTHSAVHAINFVMFEV